MVRAVAKSWGEALKPRPIQMGNSGTLTKSNTLSRRHDFVLRVARAGTVLAQFGPVGAHHASPPVVPPPVPINKMDIGQIGGEGHSVPCRATLPSFIFPLFPPREIIGHVGRYLV